MWLHLDLFNAGILRKYSFRLASRTYYTPLPTYHKFLSEDVNTSQTRKEEKRGNYFTNSGRQIGEAAKDEKIPRGKQEILGLQRS